MRKEKSTLFAKTLLYVQFWYYNLVPTYVHETNSICLLLLTCDILKSKQIEVFYVCANFYLLGEGVKPSNARVITMLIMAAPLGLESMCGILGCANQRSCKGFDKDQKEATRWYHERSMLLLEWRRMD